MSKTDMPRPRYIALRLEAPTADGPARAPSRGELGAALKGLPGAPQLTRYAWPHAIVRVTHGQEAAARQALGRVARIGNLAVRLTTLSTSGTLLALTTRVGVLREKAR